MTLADMLKILTGTQNFLQGLSKETIRLGHTLTFVPNVLSKGSVMANSTHFDFRTKPCTSFSSMGCNVSCVVNLIMPIWLLFRDMKADKHALSTSSFSDT